MLRPDFSQKAHANFQNYFLYTMCFFQHIDVKSMSIPRKIDVILIQIFILVFQ